MNRKQFIESQGATCKNWTWSWSFVNEKEKTIGIPEVLASLRDDLDKAQEALSQSEKEPFLKLDSAEIELTVSISQSFGTEVKVGFNVLGISFGAGAKENEDSQNSHKIKISLKPFSAVGVAGKPNN